MEIHEKQFNWFLAWTPIQLIRLAQKKKCNGCSFEENDRTKVEKTIQDLSGYCYQRHKVKEVSCSIVQPPAFAFSFSISVLRSDFFFPMYLKGTLALSHTHTHTNINAWTFWVYYVFCCYIESYFLDLIKAISNIWTSERANERNTYTFSHNNNNNNKKKHKDVRHGTMLKQTHKIQFKYGRKRRNSLKNNGLSIERT